MENFLGFAAGHPILAVIFLLIVASIVKLPFRVVIYTFRHRNIMKHGWPPIHLDADGDHHEVKPAEETAAETPTT